MKKAKPTFSTTGALSDYCAVSPGGKEGRLSTFERMTLTEGEELERALTRIAKQFEEISLDPGKLRPSFGAPDIEYLKHAAEFYGSWTDKRSEFFVTPELPNVSKNAVHGLWDGEIFDISFLSSFEARFPGYATRYGAFERNRMVHARMWRHRLPPRATIFAIHGWTMGDQRINSLAFLPGVFYKAGFDVVLIELPFHGRRSSPDAADSNLFPTTDVILTNEAIAQAISDLRALRLYTDSDRKSSTGWLGVSLGAYVGALWSGLDEHDFAVPIVPLTSMFEPAWEVLSQNPLFRQFKKDGLTPGMLKDIYSIHTPLNCVPKVKRGASFIIGGLGDKMVPPKQVKLLFDHWKSVDAVIKWYRGGHAASLKRTKAFADIETFLEQIVPRRS